MAMSEGLQQLPGQLGQPSHAQPLVGPVPLLQHRDQLNRLDGFKDDVDVVEIFKAGNDLYDQNTKNNGKVEKHQTPKLSPILTSKRFL